jgi:hypothetical protein
MEVNLKLAKFVKTRETRIDYIGCSMLASFVLRTLEAEKAHLDSSGEL